MKLVEDFFLIYCNILQYIAIYFKQYIFYRHNILQYILWYGIFFNILFCSHSVFIYFIVRADFHNMYCNIFFPRPGWKW